MYKMYVADKDRKQVLELPVIPSEFSDKTAAIQNEEFKTFDNGTFNFIKEPGLYTFSINSWLPAKNSNYKFLRSNVKDAEIIALIDNAVNKKEPIQFVIINGEDTFINDIFSVEGWSHGKNRRGDTTYKLDLKKYRQPSSKAYAPGWNQDAKGWWYCYDYDNYKWYAASWQLINNKWFYFKEDGYIIENNWLLYQNEWYYLKDGGYMAQNEWLQINGVYYYFWDSGHMAHNCQTPDGYYVDESGAWID